MKHLDDNRPWYQEPYVWMVISFPLAAVLAGIVTTYLAVISYDGLVVDDYYKRGLEINKRLEREKLAAEYGLAIKASLLEDKLAIDFAPTGQIRMSSEIKATLSHATRPGLDRVLLLAEESELRYSIAPITLPAGRWFVEIGTPEWRVSTYLLVR